MLVLNSDVQALDNGVWRNCKILKIEDNKYKVHFKDFQAKYDIDMTDGN